MSDNLFGEVPVAAQELSRGKHYTKPRGYAAQPGTGPEGRCCRHCAFYRRVCGGAKNYPKCFLTELKWTHGRASDILASSPSCHKFMEAKT